MSDLSSGDVVCIERGDVLRQRFGSEDRTDVVGAGSLGYVGKFAMVLCRGAQVGRHAGYVYVLINGQLFELLVDRWFGDPKTLVKVQ